MKDPVRQQGSILQSLRARTAENRHDRNKTQHVIYEGREVDQGKSEEEALLDALLELEKGSRWRIILPEILLGCVWWSVVQSFPPIILHSSIVEKKPCGFELLALCYLSPLLVTRFPAVEKFITTPTGLLLSRICLLVALLGYHATSSFGKLSLSFVGNLFVPLILSRLWQTSGPLDRSRKIYLHMSGYLLLLVLRVYWLTMDPLHSSVIVNHLAIVICVASSIYLCYADQPCQLVEGDEQSWTCRRKEFYGIRQIFALRTFVIALAFGALLFLTNWLFAESSTVGILTRSQSSTPFLEGIEIMVALATGLMVLSSKKGLISHPVWCVIGVTSGLGLCYHSFAGGCVFALFSMSLWPTLLELLSYHPPSLVLAVGMETYCMLTSASALFTGHDIVSGASLIFKGRPAILMTFTVALIIVGIQKHWMFSNDPLVAAKSLRRRSSSRSSQVLFFGSVWRRLSTIAEESSSEEISDDDAFEDKEITAKERLKNNLPAMKEEECKRFLTLIQKVTLMLLLATVWGHVTEVDTLPAPPTKDNHQQLTVATWSANFGTTASGGCNLQRTASLLNATGADVIGVTDCDTFYPFFGSYNMIRWLARTLYMFPHSSVVQNTGLGVISHSHIINSTHQLLHSKEGTYIAVTVTVNVSNDLVQYIIVKPRHHRAHLTINCSQLHLENLPETMNSSHHLPMIMVHFNFCNYTSFVSSGWKHIIDSPSEGRSTHILYKNLIRLSYINTGELVLAQFIMPDSYGEQEYDKTVTTGDERLEFFWTKFLDRYYNKETQYSVLKYFTQT